MDLQLGLALPTTPFFPIGYELKQGPFHNSNVSCSSSSSSSGGGGGTNKRRGGFDEEARVVPKTQSLLLWNTNQPNDGDDDPHDLDPDSFSTILENGGEGLVGWPPVKAWKKKLRRHIRNGRANNNRMAAANNSCGGRASNSTYVKVKMEGNAIARKIDLSVHRSFDSLTSTLKRMFDISGEQWRKSFKLAYQDREGDWLLAEDVPWRNFIGSLKCIKLVRSGI